MNRSGRLSPWTTPRTVRPACNVLISNETSVPRRALPTRTQVPRVKRQSTAWRNTAGIADVSSVKWAPPPAICRTLATASSLALSMVWVAPSARATSSRLARTFVLGRLPDLQQQTLDRGGGLGHRIVEPVGGEIAVAVKTSRLGVDCHDLATR